jgi:hypothetical protein
VAIAEAPGSYAFFLGSGVSQDAGVPTGGEVFWLAVGELYRLEGSTEETPETDGLAEWLRETGREALKYSDILQLISPDPATRRDYLAKHFGGIEPGPTHERLAELAARGLIKVFVTTNFDRLLEHALQARGIEPVVITSGEDLRRAPRREHASCYVLKPHGDYLQQTIRNTPDELATLELEVDAELREVFDRYGVVVLGYSGSDEAIAAAMRNRHSRYGLYWVARGELAEPARSIVEAAAGRVIVRDGAAEFLADLDRRLAVFQVQPSGMTALTVNDQVIALLRRRDEVGLRELLRLERREFEGRVDEIIGERHSEPPSPDKALDCHNRLMPTLERRLASLLPLLLHAPDLLADEVSSLADLVDRQGTPGGYTFWAKLADYAAWWLGFALGAFAVRGRRLGALGPLFATTVRTRFVNGTEPLVRSLPGEAGAKIGEAVMAQDTDTKWFAPWFEALRRELKRLPLLVERYPEIVSAEEEPKRSLVEFDFLLSIALAMAGQRAVGHWSMYSDIAEDFARRLHHDGRLREAVAQAMARTLDEFDEGAAHALESAHLLGEFPHSDAITILKTGST